MRVFYQEFPKVFTSLALLLALALSPASFAAPKKKNMSGASAPRGAAAAATLNQHDLQEISRQVNDKGSDESLKNSTVFAMQALMDLSQTKLPSAMKNGYQAYGKFRNSENLDRMKDINALNANSLASIGSGTLTLPTKTNTTFRRLDASFLRQGEAGKVADLFEKQSGMKREVFLTQMAETSEFKIRRSDPQMIDKAFGQLEKFIDKIPNKEFRKNVEKNINIVPETMRRGMVAQAVTKLAGFFADAGGAGVPALDSTITDKTPALLANAGGSSALETPATAGGDDKKDERKPAASGDLGLRQPLTAKEKSLKDGNALGSVVLSALQTQVHKPKVEAAPEPVVEVQAAPQLTDGEQTIFQQVTKRYRILTPLISSLP